MALAVRLVFSILWIMVAAAADGKQPEVEIFQAYPAEPGYDGPGAAPDLSPPDVHTYRTRVREAAALPVNFNGHDRLIIWGCGTTCFMGAVLDKKTGRVVLFPASICCSAELSVDDPDPILFQDDSSLVIFRGLRNGQAPDGDHYYKFENDNFVFLKTVAVAASADPPKLADAAAEKEGSPKTCRSVADPAERLACFDKAFKVVAPKAERSAMLEAPPPSAPPPVPTPPQSDDPSAVDAYKKQIAPLLRSMTLARIAMSCGFRDEDYYKFFLIAFDEKRQALGKELHMPPGLVPGMAEDAKLADAAVVKSHPCRMLMQSRDLKDLDQLKRSLGHPSR